MRLDSIALTNYRGHRSLDVRFQPGFNVVVGVNGSGKTSLLKGICECFTGLPQFIPMQDAFFALALSDNNVPFLKLEDFSGRFRFEQQFPVKVAAAGEAFGQGCAWTWTKMSQVDNAQMSGLSPGEAWAAAPPGSALPVLAFYRANRQWSGPQPHELQAATQRNARSDGYAKWFDASLDAGSLQSWVIAKCLERFQTSSETSRAFDDIDDDELDLVNDAVAAAVEDAKGLRYDLKQKSLLVDWKGPGRDSTSFETLSDGQRAVIALVADIARRMCLLNPHLGQKVTTETPGVVLIDELDMHLHPRWQRIVTAGLKAAFPAVQFIAASHSPQVIGELQPQEVILLRLGGFDHPQVSYGLDSSSVLEEIMGASARSPEVDEALSELFASLERNELDISRRRLTDLKALAPGIAEIAGAEALLKRKEVLGR